MIELHASPYVRSATDDDGSMVLLHLRTAKYTFLNRAAGAVWRWLVEHGGTVEQAIVTVADQLGVTVERFATDMEATVTLWQQRHILTTRRPKSDR